MGGKGVLGRGHSRRKDTNEKYLVWTGPHLNSVWLGLQCKAESEERDQVELEARPHRVEP